MGGAGGGVSADCPAGFGFGVVVSAVQRVQIVGAGGAGRVGDDVVQVGAAGAVGAEREGAFAVAADDVIDQVLGWAVAGGAVVQQLPGDRVGDQPPPGAARIVGEPAGVAGRDRAVSV